MKTKLLYIKANSGSIIITWSKKVHRNLYFFISNLTTKTNFHFCENLDEVHISLQLSLVYLHLDLTWTPLIIYQVS